jgi:hypothetical protein
MAWIVRGKHAAYKRHVVLEYRAMSAGIWPDHAAWLLRSTALVAALLPPMPGSCAQTLPPETRVGTYEIIDYEFDWGRDGVYRQACNGGSGNARFAFVDGHHDLWMGYVDIKTGALRPPDGQGVLVDQNVATSSESGDGPEWMASQRGSELVYTRWLDGLPHEPANLSLGFASMRDGTWHGGPIAASRGRTLPIGTLDVNAATPAVHYQDVGPPDSNGHAALGTKLYWRPMTTSGIEHPIPIANTDPDAARRWVPNSSDIIITVPAAPDAAGNIYRQVFLYHTATNAIEQLTDDPVDKMTGWMWQAPEFNNEYVFFAVSAATQLNIYRQLPEGNGSNKWTVVKTIDAPSDVPYIASPEPFVLNGSSWILLTLGSAPARDPTGTSLIALTGIVPGVDSLRKLTNDKNPPRARKDPEYYITTNGPYIYYNRYIPANGALPETVEGVYMVDTGLGPRIP